MYTFGRQYFLLGSTLFSRVPRTLAFDRFTPICRRLSNGIHARTITVYERAYTVYDNTLSGQFAAIEIKR